MFGRSHAEDAVALRGGPRLPGPPPGARVVGQARQVERITTALASEAQDQKAGHLKAHPGHRESCCTSFGLDTCDQHGGLPSLAALIPMRTDGGLETDFSRIILGVRKMSQFRPARGDRAKNAK